MVDIISDYYRPFVVEVKEVLVANDKTAVVNLAFAHVDKALTKVGVDDAVLVSGTFIFI